jgi:carbonic anhydrase
MADPARFELTTSAFGGQRSIQLSYGSTARLDHTGRNLCGQTPVIGAGTNVTQGPHHGTMSTRPSFPLRLVDGYRDFLAHRMPIELDRFRDLATRGQHPPTMLIGCCDSRVSPEVIFDAHPGELFVVRNIANLVPAFESDGACHGVFAALEFAVLVLKVRHIVVMGHARCGGIKAFAEHGPPLSPGDSVHQWMSMIAPAAERAGPREQPGYLERLEKASIARSLENLLTFSYVADAVKNGSLALHGAYFDVETGQVFARGAEADLYAEITAPERSVAAE